MKQIKLLFLLASASVTGVFAQSNGLTDMSQSRYAKMANTGINAVHWTNGFWGERFNVFKRDFPAEHVEYLEYAGSFSWFP